MASIIKRNNNFCVVYSYKDANGTPKQKWETFTDLSDAKNRKKEVEYKESVGTFVVPQCKTLNDLLPEYVALYGKSKWALSTYQANTALIANYIAPLIGSMKLQDISTRVIEGYYQRLFKYEAADPMCGKRKHQFVSPSTVRSVHKILRSAFEQAVKWKLMEKNPCIYATLPKYTSKKRDIWTAETLFRALKACDDPKLRLCMQNSPSMKKTIQSIPTRQQHLPNCWLIPLWPNSSKTSQRTYKPLYINSDSFPIGKTAAVCF